MKLKSESTVISQAVNEWFASYLPIARGCSNHTQRSYFTALSQYMQFLQEEKKSRPASFRQHLIPKTILMTGCYG